MTNLWRIRAEIRFDGHVRRIHYKIDSVREYAYPSLDIILSWCKDACEKLFSELNEKKADEKDLECLKKEIELLNAYQADWKTSHEQKARLKQ